MGDIEDMINGLLNDPGEMAKITELARSLMGGDKPRQPEPAQEGLDPGMLGRLSALMQKDSGGDDKRLLEAMRPFMSEKRRSKMDKAMKIAKLASLAELAMTEFGGSEDV